MLDEKEKKISIKLKIAKTFEEGKHISEMNKSNYDYIDKEQL